MKLFGASKGWTPIERLADGIKTYPQMKGARWKFLFGTKGFGILIVRPRKQR